MVTLVLGLALGAATAADAQDLPSQPLTLASGHVVIGTDVSFSTSTQNDESAWFNYTDYEHNTMRLMRLGVTANIRVNDRVSFLAEVRSENGDAIRPYALYVRLRPWKAARSTSRPAAFRPPSARSRGAPTPTAIR